MKAHLELGLAAAALAGVPPALDSTSAQPWTQTSAPIANWTSVASSADGRKLVATTEGSYPDFTGRIYVSTDSGATWTPTSAPSTDWSSVASSADGNKLVAMAGYPVNAIYVSTNAGASWSQTDGPAGPGGRVASSADGAQLVVARVGGYGVYGSTNSGATWMPLNQSGQCIASSADGTKLVTAYFAYPGILLGGIFTSTNSGATWTPTSAPLDYWTGWTSLASSADGTKLAATIGPTSWPTGPGPIYASPDGGGTWRATSSPVSQWSSIACSSDGIKWVAAGAAGVYTSTNSGAAWISNSVPLLQWQAVASSADGDKLAAVVSGGGIWMSQSTPTPVLSIAPTGSNAVLSWTAPSMEFVLQENGDLTTTNWTEIVTTPTLNFTNLQSEVRVSLLPGSRFYRLKHW